MSSSSSSSCSSSSSSYSAATSNRVHDETADSSPRISSSSSSVLACESHTGARVGAACHLSSYQCRLVQEMEMAMHAASREPPPGLGALIVSFLPPSPTLYGVTSTCLVAIDLVPWDPSASCHVNRGWQAPLPWTDGRQRSGVQCVHVPGSRDIVAGGGRIGLVICLDVYLYRSSTRSWLRLPDLPRPAAEHPPQAYILRRGRGQSVYAFVPSGQCVHFLDLAIFYPSKALPKRAMDSTADMGVRWISPRYTKWTVSGRWTWMLTDAVLVKNLLFLAKHHGSVTYRVKPCPTTPAFAINTATVAVTGWTQWSKHHRTRTLSGCIIVLPVTNRLLLIDLEHKSDVYDTDTGRWDSDTLPAPPCLLRDLPPKRGVLACGFAMVDPDSRSECLCLCFHTRHEWRIYWQDALHEWHVVHDAASAFRNASLGGQGTTAFTLVS
jgi:hypothetical protein